MASSFATNASAEKHVLKLNRCSSFFKMIALRPRDIRCPHHCNHSFEDYIFLKGGHRSYGHDQQSIPWSDLS